MVTYLQTFSSSIAYLPNTDEQACRVQWGRLAMGGGLWLSSPGSPTKDRGRGGQCSQRRTGQPCPGPRQLEYVCKKSGGWLAAPFHRPTLFWSISLCPCTCSFHSMFHRDFWSRWNAGLKSSLHYFLPWLSSESCQALFCIHGIHLLSNGHLQNSRNNLVEGLLKIMFASPRIFMTFEGKHCKPSRQNPMIELISSSWNKCDQCSLKTKLNH